MIKKILAVIMMVMMISAVNAGAINLELGSDTEVVLIKRVNLEDKGVKADLSAQHYDLNLRIPVGERIVITPKAGLSHVALEYKGKRCHSDEIIDIELNSAIGWNIGVDAKANLYTLAVGETDILDFSLTGGYQFTRAGIDERTKDGRTRQIFKKSILTTHEWEIGMEVSRDLEDLVDLKVTPYFGIVYSDLMGDLKDRYRGDRNRNEKITARNNVGLRLGAVARPLDDITLSLDVKLVDEFALGGKFAIKF